VSENISAQEEQILVEWFSENQTILWPISERLQEQWQNRQDTSRYGQRAGYVVYHN
jgi:hypothetical protein